MGKVGADQDLIRAIKKLIPKEEAKPLPQVVQQVVQSGPSTESLVKRGMLLLEDSDWKSAREYFSKALDIDPENCSAYIGLMLAYSEARTKAEFKAAFVAGTAKTDKNFEKAKRFAKGDDAEWISSIEKKKTVKNAENKTQLAPMINKLAAFHGLIGISDDVVAAVRLDGTVAASGYEPTVRQVSQWKGIASICVDGNEIIGLRKDGTLISTDSNGKSKYAFLDWKNITAFSIAENHTAGLMENGTVAAVGDNKDRQCKVDDLRDISAICTSESHIVGLRKNGTVVMSGTDCYGECDHIPKWKDIVAVSAGRYHIVGLEADGTVRAAGNDDRDQCNVGKWNGIVGISAGEYRTVGIKKDGTVVATIDPYADEDDGVSHWKDIIAISCNSNGYTVAGLRKDGTVVVSKKLYGETEFDVSGWKLFNDFNQYEEEKARLEAELYRRVEEERSAADKVIAAIRVKQSGKQELSPEQQLLAAKQKVLELEKVCSGYDKAAEQMNQLNAEKAEALNKLNALRFKHDSLGLFAGKEKKRLDVEISGVTEAIKQIDLNLNAIRGQLGGFNNKAAANNALAITKSDVSALQVKIEETKGSGSSGYSYNQAIEAMKNPRILAKVIAKASDLLIAANVPICFGNYLQVYNNVKTPIEWVVLKKTADRALLISKYALDSQQYHTSTTPVTWERCSLRYWLNNFFISSAFSEEEQKMISGTTVTADFNTKCKTSPGSDTTDKIFLLSVPEASNYFDSKTAIKASNGNCWWWLRSPGSFQNYAAYVRENGSVVYNGSSVAFGKVAVRPALWINLDS